MEQPDFFCWHVHHEIFLEPCYGYDERAKYIRTEKPSHEQALRLRLFKVVKGQLPQEVVEAGKPFGKAGKTFDEAGKAYREAEKTFNEAGKAYFKAEKAFNKAGKAYFKARKAYDEAEKAYREVLSNHRDEIEALHKDECFDCPWDGETILPAA